MLLCDFHIHTTMSDGQFSIAEVIDFYGQRGFGAIAITDHLCEKKALLGKAARYLKKTIYGSEFERYLGLIEREAKRAWNQYKMLVVPGVEITKNSFRHKNSAHILGLGIKSYINPDLDIVSICNEIRNQGGLTVAAHPVSTRKLEAQTYYLWNHRERLAPYFDAWEVASGPHLFPEVLNSGLPMIANSDLHRPSQLRSWKTVVRSEPTIRAVLEAIRLQDVAFQFYGQHEPTTEFIKSIRQTKSAPVVIGQPNLAL